MVRAKAAAGAILVAATLLGIGLGVGQETIPPGITEPATLPFFDPGLPACSPPPALRPELMFVQDNDRQFMQGVDAGLSAAAENRGLDYRVALADDDPVRMINDVRAAINAGTGALVVAPVNAASIAPTLQQAIALGTYVGTVVPPPAVTILNAPQYMTGERLAHAAADYIEIELGGEANVVLLTHDSLEFLAPRFTAMRDVLRRVPGANIVADISPSPVNVQGGYATMKLILLAHQDIDVVLGADTVVLGALQALREAGRARPDQFLGGIDGEPAALAELVKPGSPYKLSVGLASPVFGYALGQFAADWLEGKSVPQAMDILPTVITAESIERYEEDLRDPASVFTDPVRRHDYLRMYGNICFETRDQYLNFPWSSE